MKMWNQNQILNLVMSDHHHARQNQSFNKAVCFHFFKGIECCIGGNVCFLLSPCSVKAIASLKSNK